MSKVWVGGVKLYVGGVGGVSLLRTLDETTEFVAWSPMLFG